MEIGRAGASRASPPAAHQTLRVLGYLAAQRGPTPAAVIARDLGIPRASMYRLLGALEEHGYALRYPEAGRWGIGLAAFELSSAFSRQEPLTRLGAPILAALVDAVGESAHLAVLNGPDVVYLVEERAPRRPALVTDVGVRLPAHRTASGRALLATLPPAQLRALFADPDLTRPDPDGEPFRLSHLRRDLERVRREGFAAEDEDVTRGFASVSVAVRDAVGWPAAGITVTFPRDHVPVEDWPALAETIRAHASALARRIRGDVGRVGPGASAH